MNKKTVAISVGDINGVGLQLILENHNEVSKLVNCIYCINEQLLNQALLLLDIRLPSNFKIYPTKGNFKIKAGKVSKKAGKFSYNSFVDAINLANAKKVDAICTMPINKQSWSKAGISYVGHTDMLRDVFKKDAIMMLGCEKMYVALFTEHIPLKNVAEKVKKENLVKFFIDFYNSTKFEKVGVLGLNPHAGDGGVLGDEEIKEIIPAINLVNEILKKEVFFGPLVPDTTFTTKKGVFIAMYHDQGLAHLKLYILMRV